MLYKHSRKGRATIFVVYVDDIFITKNEEDERCALEPNVMRELDNKNLGHMKYFLRLETSHSFMGIMEPQKIYIYIYIYIFLIYSMKQVFLLQTRKIPIEVNHIHILSEEEECVDRGT